MSAQPIPIHETKSRLVLTQGGKGGTGKTTFITALVDWYDEHQLPYTLIALDTEASKSRGSLVHYFPGKAVKIDINRPEGLDHLINVLQDGPPVVIADMGAGAATPGSIRCTRAHVSWASPLPPLGLLRPIRPQSIAS